MTPHGPKALVEPTPVLDDVVCEVRITIAAYQSYLHLASHAYAKSAILVPGRLYLLQVGFVHVKVLVWGLSSESCEVSMNSHWCEVFDLKSTWLVRIESPLLGQKALERG
ncbi:hypothetical protein B296_00045293 [Ensete ventricosum]|uniref:Uncharacterized protein n=1 Tax=Ensete ventricosum TaxID=4639 RepID=A0A426YIR9_ENSVE|nr:hypothetical protein B296_00045293 [Ensete ventricosum]